MKRALVALLVLLAGLVLDQARAGERWSLFGLGKKPTPSTVDQIPPESTSATVGELPVGTVPGSMPGIAAEPLLSSQGSAAPAPHLAPNPVTGAPRPVGGHAESAIAAPALLAGPLPVAPVVEGQTPAPTPVADAAVRRVKSKHILIDYQLKDVGPSGVSGVELWYTPDGQRWQKAASGVQLERPYHAVVEEEGTYGMVLLARNGLGGGKEPPKAGEPAQFWIEVDATKPVVAVTGVQAGTGGQTAVVTWSATDKNLAPRPIALFFTDQNGQWQPIATGLENSGSFTWRLPTGLPYTFRVRAEATDLAGNVGSAETPIPAQIDTAQPVVTEIHITTAD